MTQQITKQTLDAIMQDERFQEVSKDATPGVLIAVMLLLARYRKELPGEEAVTPTTEGSKAVYRALRAEGRGPSIIDALVAAARSAAPDSDSDSEPESEFDSECPVVAQVAALTEQVTTLQDDVKTLVEICRSQQNQLKLLKEAVFADANFFNRKVAIGN